jgi:hypothetical protein
MQGLKSAQIGEMMDFRDLQKRSQSGLENLKPLRKASMPR